MSLKLPAQERIGIENLSVFGLPPVAFVQLAAALGCRHISASMAQGPINPEGYPWFSLAKDAALRREMLAVMRDCGVSISLGEGMNIHPNVHIRESVGTLDVMAELGIKRINTVTLDPDLAASFDQFAILAEMAAARGMETTLELAPSLPIADLPTALAALDHVGRADFRLLIDTMHFARSGATPAELAALDPARIGYAHLSDAPMISSAPSYMQEAMTDRRVPGDGELPLADILAALPPDCIVGLEVPRLAEALAGVAAYDRLLPCIAAAKALLDL